LFLRFNMHPSPPASRASLRWLHLWAGSIVGLLVLVRIRTRFALVAGFLLILTLTFGATLNQDWERWIAIDLCDYLRVVGGIP
jgi:hypothetical protein